MSVWRKDRALRQGRSRMCAFRRLWALPCALLRPVAFPDLGAPRSQRLDFFFFFSSLCDEGNNAHAHDNINKSHLLYGYLALGTCIGVCEALLQTRRNANLVADDPCWTIPRPCKASSLCALYVCSRVGKSYRGRHPRVAPRPRPRCQIQLLDIAGGVEKDTGGLSLAGRLRTRQKKICFSMLALTNPKLRGGGLHNHG